MMRLSVSNLAWPSDSDDQAFALLATLGVRGVEVAPTRLANWEDITTAQLAAYRRRVEDAGLVVSSLQALLFGTSGLALLGDRPSFDAMLEHMRRVTDIAAALGAVAMVFGSPRNRLRGDMPPADAWELGRGRWREMGAIAASGGTAIVIEPVPPYYGGDFLTQWGDVLAMVREVDHPGIRVHLDTGCVDLGGDLIQEAIAASAPWLWHFHAAQPDLASFAEPAANHADAGSALHAVQYKGWVAIEMREQSPDPLGAMATAIRAVQAMYRMGQ